MAGRGRAGTPHVIVALQCTASASSRLSQVNESLKMGKGKIGAQCAHAAVGLVEEVAFSEPGLLNAWARGGQAKICLRGLDTPQLVRELA